MEIISYNVVKYCIATLWVFFDSSTTSIIDFQSIKNGLPECDQSLVIDLQDPYAANFLPETCGFCQNTPGTLPPLDMLSRYCLTVKSSTTRISCNVHCSPVLSWRNYENERYYEPGEDVMKRVWHGLTYDFRRAKRRYQEARRDAWHRLGKVDHVKASVQNYELIPSRTEFLIIGGGLCGSATAFWMKQLFRDEDFTVTVIEDPEKFSSCKSMLSVGELTQQFSQPELVEMALFSAEFMRHTSHHLRILDSEPPRVDFHPCGFMHMARNDEEAAKLNESWKMQISKGVKVAFYNKDQAEQNFPFINFHGITAVTYGLENEGFFDPWQLLGALREKNITLGVTYHQAELQGYQFRQLDMNSGVHGRFDDADSIVQGRKVLESAVIQPKMTGASSRPVRFYRCVNCAGPWAGDVAKLMGIGSGSGVLSVPVPIEPRKRQYFILHAPEVPAMKMPAFKDPTGVFCRPYQPGYSFICGKTPTKEEDAQINHKDRSVDYNYFYKMVWPVLVQRVPSFRNANIVNAWTSVEDVNTFDDAPILGEHLQFQNFYTMSGFANYGAQMSLAAARLYSEKALEYAYITTNVRKFDMRRLMLGRKEEEVYKM